MAQYSLKFSLPRPAQLVQYLDARVRSLDIELDTIRQVLNRYGVRLIREPRNLPLGRRSRNIAVHTSNGKKVLKRYRPEWKTSAIIFGHSILAYLAKVKFPAPRLVVALDGNTFVQQDGFHYALFDFIEGTNYSSKYITRQNWLDLVSLAGQTLADFHRQTTGFVPDGSHHLGFISYQEDRHRDLAWYVGQLDVLRERSRDLSQKEDSVHAKWLIDKTEPLTEELHHLERVLNAALLSRLIIHGDYGFQNLLFQNDVTVTPLDFELSRIEWRLCELVTSLARFKSSNGKFDFDAMRSFVSAYQAEYPFSAEEWQYLPQVWKYRRIQRAVLFWRSYFETDKPDKRLESARVTLNLADWVMEHREEFLRLNPVFQMAGV